MLIDVKPEYVEKGLAGIRAQLDTDPRSQGEDLDRRRAGGMRPKRQRFHDAGQADLVAR